MCSQARMAGELNQSPRLKRRVRQNATGPAIPALHASSRRLAMRRELTRIQSPQRGTGDWVVTGNGPKSSSYHPPYDHGGKPVSFIRRYGAQVSNHAKWTAHVFAFAPEPETQATWRCPVCKRRRPVHVKRCCK